MCLEPEKVSRTRIPERLIALSLKAEERYTINSDDATCGGTAWSTQAVNDFVYACRLESFADRAGFYCRSSWRSASLATPETVPVNFPVLAKKTGLFEVSAKTGAFVSVNLRLPEASLKRPVPPAI